MKELSDLERDLEEILLHVKKIKEEQDNFTNKNNEYITPLGIIKDKSSIMTEESDFMDNIDNDLFEIVKLSQKSIFDNEKLLDQDFLEINQKNIRGICDLCSSSFIFEENPSGLVINEEFFACENCCKELSKEELENWTKSKMKSSNRLKPIALWLMEKNNKTKLF